MKNQICSVRPWWWGCYSRLTWGFARFKTHIILFHFWEAKNCSTSAATSSSTTLGIHHEVRFFSRVKLCAFDGSSNFLLL
jgi:hypothetical protein